MFININNLNISINIQEHGEEERQQGSQISTISEGIFKEEGSSSLKNQVSILKEKKFELSDSISSDKSRDADKAALIIQKYARGYLVRKPLISSHLYFQYSALCKCNKTNMLQAQNGKTPVFLPQEMPQIVLKHSKRKEAIQRFHQMQEVRLIINKQGSSHLIIPKANLCREFLIEERLPINDDPYHIMELYLSQPELFNEAVCELTRLFSHAYIGDLVSRQDIPLGHIEGVEDYVRYDNLPLYIIEKKGIKKGLIGLIDLEHFQNEPNECGLENLVRIFPLHLEQIKKEAKSLGLKVEDAILEACAEKGNKYLKVGFTDHLEWLRQNGISSSLPKDVFNVSSERKKELIAVVKNEILKIDQGIMDLYTRNLRIYPTNNSLFKKNLDEAKKSEMIEWLAGQFTSNFLTNIQKQILEIQQSQTEIQKGELTESVRVKMGSPILDRRKLYKESDFIFWNKNYFKKFDRGSFDPIPIAEQLLYVFMEEFVRGGEIFFFDPCYNSGHDLCWVRY